MEEFKINLEHKDGISFIYLDGFLDAHTSGELETCFEKLIEENKFSIIVNFNRLSYISSAGLGVFMAFIESVRNKAGDIKLCGMNEKIYNVFDMLGFPVLFEIYSMENEAIEKFKQKKSVS